MLRADWLAGMAAFKAVLLEGTEVVFIVLAIGARPACWRRRPSARRPPAPWSSPSDFSCARLWRGSRNSMKFAVGALLTGFGVFWCCEGLGAPWPGATWLSPR